MALEKVIRSLPAAVTRGETKNGNTQSPELLVLRTRSRIQVEERMQQLTHSCQIAMRNPRLQTFDERLQAKEAVLVDHLDRLRAEIGVTKTQLEGLKAKGLFGW